jgi:hypothetical protein
MSSKSTNRRPSYTGPEIRTIPVSELLEMIGPAQGFSSGVGTTDPMASYPSSFGPGTGGNISKN